MGKLRIPPHKRVACFSPGEDTGTKEKKKKALASIHIPRALFNGKEVTQVICPSESFIPETMHTTKKMMYKRHIVVHKTKINHIKQLAQDISADEHVRYETVEI